MLPVNITTTLGCHTWPASVTKTKRAVTTQVRPSVGPDHRSLNNNDKYSTSPWPDPLPTTANIALALFNKHCCVAVAKRYVQHSNSGRNSGNTGRLLTSSSQNFDVLGTFCGRKYGHFDVIRSTAKGHSHHRQVIC